MNVFSTTLDYYIYNQPTDMRKSFDGLCGLIMNNFGENITTGKVYLFFNKPRNKVKIIIWDRDGIVIYYKMLSKGTFSTMQSSKDKLKIQIKWDELMMLLEGISITKIKRKTRHSI